MASLLGYPPSGDMWWVRQEEGGRRTGCLSSLSEERLLPISEYSEKGRPGEEPYSQSSFIDKVVVG